MARAGAVLIGIAVLTGVSGCAAMRTHEPAPVAQARYLERFRVLGEAVGIMPAPDAWHTE